MLPFYDRRVTVARKDVAPVWTRSFPIVKEPSGIVKEGELEKEKGKLIWSFEIATPDSKDITEVNVDAITGEIVSVEKKKD